MMEAEVEIAVVTATFTARTDRVGDLAAVLARYVVLTRGEAGCRNVDLLVSATESEKFVVVEKWETPARARAHLDTELMATMATAAVPLLAGPPQIDLLETISAHDLA